MDLALNNLHRLICHKTQRTNIDALIKDLVLYSSLCMCLHLVKYFPVFLCITKNSIKHPPFAYT